MGLCILGFGGEYFGQSKVSQLYVIARIHEYVPRLHISVKDLPMLFVFMAVPQSLDDLHEYFPNHILSYMILLYLALFNELSHISSLAIFHNDVQSALLLIYDPRIQNLLYISLLIVVFHYVWVAQFFQN
jgi:hypothetical protein